jgi:hypothetical protein
MYCVCLSVDLPSLLSGLTLGLRLVPLFHWKTHAFTVLGSGLEARAISKSNLVLRRVSLEEERPCQGDYRHKDMLSKQKEYRDVVTMTSLILACAGACLPDPCYSMRLRLHPAPIKRSPSVSRCFDFRPARTTKHVAYS